MMKVRYYGWSAMTLEHDALVVGLDPYYRKTAKVQYATIDDFPKMDIIALSHNHPEHALDLREFIRRDWPVTLVPGDYHWIDIPEELRVVQEVTVVTEHMGTKIESFLWPHRPIDSDMVSEDEEPDEVELDLPCFGQMITFPDGDTFMNLSEGANFLLEGEILFDLARKHQPRILAMGYQLDFVKDVARAAEVLRPEVVLIYHPHEALFKELGLETKPVEEFIAAIKDRLPSVKVFDMTPMEEVDI